MYGRLRSNQIRSSYLKSSRFVGEGQTFGLFCMYDMGHWPIVTEDEVSRIKGELYRIEDDVWDYLQEL